MRARWIAGLLACLGASVAFALSLGLAYAVADDYAQRAVVPSSVTAVDVDLAGLSRSAAIEAVRAGVEAPLMEPIVVACDGRERVLDPSTFVSIDTTGMVDEALAPRRSASFSERLNYRLFGAPARTEIPLRLSVDTTAVAAWVAGLSAEVDRAAVDASLTVSGTKVHIRPSEDGVVVDRAGATAIIVDSLTGGAKLVDLPLVTRAPRVTEDSFGKTIVVSLSRRRLYLYDGDNLTHSYGVAIGAPGFGTPRGWWKIVNKRYMPTWRNPGSAWAQGMPDSIPPGPGNPLGTRALDLDAPAIRIHGTSKSWSIGRAASHGCMRMHRWDIEDLYDRVSVGTRVVIVR